MPTAATNQTQKTLLFVTNSDLYNLLKERPEDYLPKLYSECTLLFCSVPPHFPNEEILETIEKMAGKKELPDVVVVDFLRPGHDTPKLLAQIKKLFPSMKIIVLGNQPGVTAKALNGSGTKMNEFIPLSDKGSDPANIARAIQHILREPIPVPSD